MFSFICTRVIAFAIAIDHKEAGAESSVEQEEERKPKQEIEVLYEAPEFSKSFSNRN